MFMSTHTHISEKPHMEFSHFKKKFHFQASAAIKKFKNKIPEKKAGLGAQARVICSADLNEFLNMQIEVERGNRRKHYLKREGMWPRLCRGGGKG